MTAPSWPGGLCIVDDALDAITVAGAVATHRTPLMVVVDPRGGRPLPVAARDLTTLDHLSGGVLAVGLVVRAGSDPQVLRDAVALLSMMWSEEASTFSSATWTLDAAPNRPLPVHPGGPQLRWWLEDDDAAGVVDAVADLGLSTGPLEGMVVLSAGQVVAALRTSGAAAEGE
jgi:alkanesulfonate monooxygenase SsuD/methylene tetrahydromethanopterin reductase-like flavin-dependent oxidoreductase (luciferase family)